MSVPMAWVSFGPELLPLLVFAVSFALDPRKFRTGLYFFWALAWLAAATIGVSLATISKVNGDAALYALIGVAIVIALTVVGLAVFLIIAGVTLVRREGFNVRRLLSVVLGLLMLGFFAWALASFLPLNTARLAWLIMASWPASYLGIGFASFALYSRFYPAWMARFGAPVNAVVVLGSGLIDGRVPPLLAARLAAGRAVFARSVAAGRQPLLITSGGRGPDEPVAEAVAMRDHLLEQGVVPGVLRTEERSRNTEQNLAYSAELLRAEKVVGPVAVVSSDFHALRAAFLMRKAGIAGYTTGARTPRWFWPTAIIREYVAVLRDHFWLNAVLLGLSCVPLVLALIQAITNRLG